MIGWGTVGVLRAEVPLRPRPNISKATASNPSPSWSRRSCSLAPSMEHRDLRVVGRGVRRHDARSVAILAPLQRRMIKHYGDGETSINEMLARWFGGHLGRSVLWGRVVRSLGDHLDGMTHICKQRTMVTRTGPSPHD